MKTIDALKAAKARIENPANWTRGWFARDHRGEDCGSLSHMAVSWCALGTLYRTAGDDAPLRHEMISALWSAASEMSDSLLLFPQDVNDMRGHEAVLEMYDRAIAAESKVTA